MTERPRETSTIYDFLPRGKEVLYIKKLTHETLNRIWESKVEYSLLKTKNNIVLQKGSKHSPPTSSYQYTRDVEAVIVEGHSHPLYPGRAPKNPLTGAADCFSLADWYHSLGRETKTICLIYKGGALSLEFQKIPKNRALSEERLSRILEDFIYKNQTKKIYKPNRKSLPYKERLYYVVEEFRGNNIKMGYQIIQDLLSFASKKRNINIRRYDLTYPNSGDTKDFLALYNKIP